MAKKWDLRQECTMRTWLCEADQLSKHHAQLSARYTLMHRLFSISQIICSAGASLLSVVAATRASTLPLQPYASVAATLLLSLGSYFSWNLCASEHSTASSELATLAHDLELSLHGGGGAGSSGGSTLLENTVTFALLGQRYSAIMAKAPSLPRRQRCKCITTTTTNK